MIFTILSSVVAAIGLLGGNHTIFVVGATACLLRDLFGLLSGQLKLGFGAIIFYVIGYSLADGNFVLGMLYGATISAIFELVFMALFAPFFLRK